MDVRCRSDRLRFLQVFPIYTELLQRVYSETPSLAAAHYQLQLQTVERLGFAAVHLIAPALSRERYESAFVFSNCIPLQRQWLREKLNGDYSGPDLERAILWQQIDALRPDILYFSDPLTFDAAFLSALPYRPKLVMGWRAANIPVGTNWSGYDLILSSLSGVRDIAPSLGAARAVNFWPGFPRWMFEELQAVESTSDVCFCGQWTTAQHGMRNGIISECVAASARGEFSLDLHLSGLIHEAPAEVQSKNRGGVFGLDMQKALRGARMGLDARGVLRYGNVDLGRNDTANMRLFEVTGMGRMLLTEYRDNLREAFEPGVEIETFKDVPELFDKIQYYCSHGQAREAIARRGQERCFRDHSLEVRALEMDRIISDALGIQPLVKTRHTSCGVLRQENQEVSREMHFPEGKDSNAACLQALAQAINFVQTGDGSSAYRLLEPFLQLGAAPRDFFLVAGIASMQVGRREDALSLWRRELEHFHDNRTAMDLFNQVSGNGVHRDSPAPLALSHYQPRNEVERRVVELLVAAENARRNNDGPLSLSLVDEAKKSGVVVPDLHWIRSQCLNLVGRHEEALDEICAQLKIDPRHQNAREEFDRLSKALGRKVLPQQNPEQRSYHSAIPLEVLRSIQSAGHTYTYRGVPMIKNPFDMALYPLLLWKAKPRTIIEVGSKNGGSALWFADMLENFGIDGRVVSVDIVKVEDVSHPRVTFLKGDGRNLRGTLSRDFLDSLPRPWLIVEDADHSYETSKAVLDFFHPHMLPDEYMIIEDGIISDLNSDADANSGPHRALKEFFLQVPGQYDIDSSLADMFGYNYTWCTNGFLRKKRYALNPSVPAQLVSEFNLDDPAPLGAECQMSQNERFQLYTVVRQLASLKHPQYRFVEIGSFSGGSLALLYRAFARLGVPFDGITVEPFGTEKFYELLPKLADRISHLKQFSSEARAAIAERIARDGVSPQLIFIDGDHTFDGVRQDIENYYPLLAPGGFIVFHDYLPALNEQNRDAIHFHHAGTEPGIRGACELVLEQKHGLRAVEFPLMYPSDPTQTQPHLPVIPGVFSTIRVYQKPR